MTEYYLNETVVTFPGNIIQDSTINMLRLSDPDAALIISRGQMQEGDELASQIEQQMKKLEKQVKDLHYTPVQVPLRNLHRDTPPGIKSGLFQPVALKVQAGML